jgi:hypothetical protein
VRFSGIFNICSFNKVPEKADGSFILWFLQNVVFSVALAGTLHLKTIFQAQ